MYLNLDVLEREGWTQAEWALKIHRGEAHSLGALCRGTGTSSPGGQFEGGRFVLSPRCPNGCADGPTLDRYLAAADRV